MGLSEEEGSRRDGLNIRLLTRVSSYGFDVLFALCSQRKPGIRHREQRTLRFEIIETLD